MSTKPKSITCGICFKILQRPVTLRCHDSFCYDCVLERLKQNNDSGLLCPLCGIPYVDLDSAHLADFANRELAAYIEAISLGTTQRLCQWCEAVPATVQCAECMCTYCAECSAAVHKNVAKRDHTTGKLSDAYKAFYRRCVHRGHEEYKAEFYCTECDELCCAYCLQVGPHKEHRNVNVARAATEARQRMTQDMQALSQSKTRLETQASELNRVMVLYNDSYDSVENMITERFNSFKQQLMQKELEVRKTLAALRDSGDSELTASRRGFLAKLNSVNEGFLRYRTLQNGGADYEVLESRALLEACMHTDTLAVSGNGFKLLSMGDLVVTGVDVQLDLHTTQGGESWRPGDSSTLAAAAGAGRTGATDLGGASATSASQLLQRDRRGIAGIPERPLRLTFPVDDDVEATVCSDGVRLRCIARGGGATQIGVRSKETMEAIATMFPEDRGIISWQVRLETVSDTFLGVVEKASRSVVPEGFYWKPACANVVDGQLGHPTTAVRKLPVCESGDTIRFVYDTNARTLRVVVNLSEDYGVIVSDLHARIAACFIFYPGECVTVLF